MTVVNINLKNVGSSTSSIDSVTFYSPVYRDGTTTSELVSTAEENVPLVDGVADVDLIPGPVRVHFKVRGIADTVAKDGIVPDSGPVSLNEVLQDSLTYTPGLVNSAVAEVNAALASALNAVEQAVDDELGAVVQTAVDAATSAESKVDSYTPRVDALEALGGLSPESPVDGQTADLVAQTGTLTRNALDASYVTHMPTATQLANVSLPVGAVVRTNGFHSLGDGGACTYLTIPSVEKSYDLPGAGCAYRPQNESGVISPKQFGTYNNGSDFDNFPLQACYDFSEDYRVLTIDGQGLTYTIGPVNPYNEEIRGFAHKGALMRSGRTMRNANFFVHESSVEGTCAFSVDLIDDGVPTYIENCTFDGNRDALIPHVTFRGREDAGMHLVHLYNRVGAAQSRGEKEFTPTGDIFFHKCSFDNAYSYGVAIIEPVDALLRLADCKYKIYGICVLLHATRVEIDGADVTLGEARTGMVISPFHAEEEMSGNYTGSKRSSIDVRKVRVNRTGGSSAGLVKIHYGPMQGVNYDSIVIDDVECVGEVGILEIYTGANSNHPWNETDLEIGNISITRCISGSRQKLWLLCPETGGNPINVDEIYIDKVNAWERIQFGGAVLGRLTISEYQVQTTTNPFLAFRTSISNLEIGNVTGETYDYGFFRASTSSAVTVDNFTIKGGKVVQNNLSFIEGNFKKVDIENLEVTSTGEETRRLVVLSSEEAEVSVRDVLMKSITNPWRIVESTALTGGWIHARNVRHISDLTPTVVANKLPAERKILEQVTPLVSVPAEGE